MGDKEEEIIVKPHAHDVLCGRGGLTNQHAGNEWYRRLVRSNRPLYRSCPKHTKLLVSKAIVQAVQQQDPPGRFLEMSKKENGMWKPITYKRAVDKTSQALREKERDANGAVINTPAPAPPADGKAINATIDTAAVINNAGRSSTKSEPTNITDLTKEALERAGLPPDQLRTTPPDEDEAEKESKKSAESKKRKSDFVKPSWWGSGIPAKKTKQQQPHPSSQQQQPQQEADPLPLPLNTRQSSMFRFLSQTGIFGSSSTPKGSQQRTAQQQPQPGPASRDPFGNFGGGIPTAFGQQQQQQQQQRRRSSTEAAGFPMMNQMNSLSSGGGSGGGPAHANMNGSAGMFNQGMQGNSMSQMGIPNNGSNHGFMGFQHRNSNNNGMVVPARNTYGEFDPLLSPEMGNPGPMGMSANFPSQNQQLPQYNNQQQRQQQQQQPPSDDLDDAPPALNRLTSQVSDWLTSFWPLGKEEEAQPQQPMQQPLQMQRQQQQHMQMPHNHQRMAPMPQNGGNVPPVAATAAAPPPPADELESGISTTIFKLASTPSRIFSNLKSGVSSYFDSDSPIPADTTDPEPLTVPIQNRMMSGGTAPQQAPVAAAPPVAPPGDNQGQAPLGSEPVRRGSLLDDYEDSPMETRLRSVTSI